MRLPCSLCQFKGRTPGGQSGRCLFSGPTFGAHPGLPLGSVAHGLTPPASDLGEAGATEEPLGFLLTPPSSHTIAGWAPTLGKPSQFSRIPRTSRA